MQCKINHNRAKNNNGNFKNYIFNPDNMFIIIDIISWLNLVVISIKFADKTWLYDLISVSSDKFFFRNYNCRINFEKTNLINNIGKQCSEV